MNIYGLNKELTISTTSESCEKEIILLNFVYLHGILEDKNGCDLVATTKEIHSVISACQFGKFNVNVILRNNESEPGILFYWHDDTTNRAHGLIVSESDGYYMNDAKEKFYNKANFI